MIQKIEIIIIIIPKLNQIHKKLSQSFSSISVFLAFIFTLLKLNFKKKNSFKKKKKQLFWDYVKIIKIIKKSINIFINKGFLIKKSIFKENK